jgi:hypothetical protein
MPRDSTALTHMTPANARGRSATWPWPLGLLLIAVAIGSGILSENQLRGTGMPDLTGSGALGVHLLPVLFAFGLPLGMALLALAAAWVPSGAPGRRALAAVLAALVVVAPILVPVIAGREPMPGYFGTGGTLIALCAVITFWNLGRIRRALAPPLTRAVDLVIGATACLVMAAWNLCGSAAMPSFLLDPEQVLRLHTLPFATGQMKTVLAQLAAGFLLLALATWSARAELREDRDAAP